MAHPDDEELTQLADDPTRSLDEPTRRRLLRHIASARFSSETKQLSQWNRVGVPLAGRPHPARRNEMLTPATELSSLEWHVLKHTASEEWDEETTPEEYLADLRAAVSHPRARLHVGKATVTYPRGVTRSASKAATLTDAVAAAAAMKRAVIVADTDFITFYEPSRRAVLSVYRVSKNDSLPFRTWQNHRAFPP